VVLLRFAGEAGDERRADRDAGDALAQLLEQSSSCASFEVCRRIALSMRSLMCCSGMSMYLTMPSSRAIASIISSLKFDG
jgi:hypothetical protein